MNHPLNPGPIQRIDLSNQAPEFNVKQRGTLQPRDKQPVSSAHSCLGGSCRAKELNLAKGHGDRHGQMNKESDCTNVDNQHELVLRSESTLTRIAPDGHDKPTPVKPSLVAHARIGRAVADINIGLLQRPFTDNALRAP